MYAFQLLLVYLNVPMVTYRKTKEEHSLLISKWEICCSNPSTKTRDQSYILLKVENKDITTMACCFCLFTVDVGQVFVTGWHHTR